MKAKDSEDINKLFIFRLPDGYISKINIFFDEDDLNYYCLNTFELNKVL